MRVNMPMFLPSGNQRRNGESWTVTVTDPGDGYVSLRTQMADTDGNAVTKTLWRAYAVAK